MLEREKERARVPQTHGVSAMQSITYTHPFSYRFCKLGSKKNSAVRHPRFRGAQRVLILRQGGDIVPSTNRPSGTNKPSAAVSSRAGPRHGWNLSYGFIMRWVS